MGLTRWKRKSATYIMKTKDIPTSRLEFEWENFDRVFFKNLLNLTGYLNIIHSKIPFGDNNDLQLKIRIIN